ncbi:unnamed protein product [Adineta steineri]|uniref:Uncharacterized protein n=1 Tax=Adineta steineri TaxID=433720 RepID=A0A818JVE9_9BILA|nr:unnamed protein product [Adineta steineri]CAF0916335.1 unnamed protein product [Adineta steineri]CAF0931781.1 unnamed protein product [Adineta steineri]CAF3546442.1 unnamed protein product [Adineta steineri]CAF3582376.1 unnamed protein product [Adineta steineri]
MLFPSSRPYRIPSSTADSQYDTTGYSSSSYTKRPRSSIKSDLYAVRNDAPNGNPSSRQYPSTRRRSNYTNEPLSDVLNYEYSQSEQHQPIYSTINTSQRPTVNYLLP